jgi:hypothetical protein
MSDAENENYVRPTPPEGGWPEELQFKQGDRVEMIDTPETRLALPAFVGARGTVEFVPPEDDPHDVNIIVLFDAEHLHGCSSRREHFRKVEGE